MEDTQSSILHIPQEHDEENSRGQNSQCWPYSQRPAIPCLPGTVPLLPRHASYVQAPTLSRSVLMLQDLLGVFRVLVDAHMVTGSLHHNKTVRRLLCACPRHTHWHNTHWLSCDVVCFDGGVASLLTRSAPLKLLQRLFLSLGYRIEAEHLKEHQKAHHKAFVVTCFFLWQDSFRMPLTLLRTTVVFVLFKVLLHQGPRG